MKTLCAIAALAAVVSGSAVSARSQIHLSDKAVVVDGSIFRVNPQAGDPDFDGASTVDRWHITVDASGVYSFNVLSWEVANPFDPGAMSMDVNNDGEIAFIDSYLRIFHDDGDLTADDWFAGNDDRFDAAGYSDGSIYGYDSYLSLHLDPGNYVLAIGAYHMSIPDAVLGLDVDNDYYPVSWDDDLGEFTPSDHGDYQITMVLVPSPGAIALAGLAGLLSVRRRRR